MNVVETISKHTSTTSSKKEEIMDNYSYKEKKYEYNPKEDPYKYNPKENEYEYKYDYKYR